MQPIHKIFLIVLLTMNMLTFAGNDWENQDVIAINKEPARSTLIPTANYEHAIASKEDSPYYQSLNGVWKFKYVFLPDDRPMDFYEPQVDLSEWDDIDVPSCWW